jgi:hypothetical protein
MTGNSDNESGKKEDTFWYVFFSLFSFSKSMGTAYHISSFSHSFDNDNYSTKGPISPPVNTLQETSVGKMLHIGSWPLTSLLKQCLMKNTVLSRELLLLFTWGTQSNLSHRWGTRSWRGCARCEGTGTRLRCLESVGKFQSIIQKFLLQVNRFQANSHWGVVHKILKHNWLLLLLLKLKNRFMNRCYFFSHVELHLVDIITNPLLQTHF